MRYVERNEIDTRSPDLVRTQDGLDGNGAGRFTRKTPLPSINDRCGQLVITGYLKSSGGGVGTLVVQCDCGRPEHRISVYSWTAARVVRCNACGKEQAVKTRQKKYLHYAGACPDIEHRRRLLGRIGAIQGRCHNPKNSEWMAYGGRGITCWWRDEYGVERIGSASRSGKLQTMRWKYDMLKYLVTLDGWDVPANELDRIDNDKGYAPGNLRFISRAENMCNKRNVNLMSQRIINLEAELACLRSGERRTA